MRRARKILKCESGAVEQGDVGAVLPAGLYAGNEMPEFRVDVVRIEDALRKRHVDLAAMCGLLHVIDHHARVSREIGGELLFAGSVGTDRIDVRARLYPITLHDRRTSRGDR